MGKSVIHVKQAFSAPVDTVFEHLAVHTNLEILFGTKIKRIKDAAGDNPNVLGSVRSLKIGLAPAFEETVDVFQPNSRIEYFVSTVAPVKNHRGVMIFSGNSDSKSSHLDYRIELDGTIPGTGPVIAKFMQFSIQRGLASIARQLAVG